MTTTPKSEYEELKDAGMTDHNIRMARNTGASHKAILLWAKRHRRAEEICGECGGTGEIVNDGPYSICDDCNGTGIESTPKSDSTASTTHENPKSDKLTSCPTDLD